MITESEIDEWATRTEFSLTAADGICAKIAETINAEFPSYPWIIESAGYWPGREEPYSVNMGEDLYDVGGKVVSGKSPKELMDNCREYAKEVMDNPDIVQGIMTEAGEEEEA